MIKTRKAPVYLSDREFYAIYRHCIENKSVIQIETATRYRVQPKVIAEEINSSDLFKDKQISDYHVRQAIEHVIDWQDMLDKLPMPQETVNEDQLNTRIKQLQVQLEQTKLENDSYKKIAVLMKSADEIVKQAKIKCAELSRVLHTPLNQ